MFIYMKEKDRSFHKIIGRSISRGVVPAVLLVASACSGGESKTQIPSSETIPTTPTPSVSITETLLPSTQTPIVQEVQTPSPTPTFVSGATNTPEVVDIQTPEQRMMQMKAYADEVLKPEFMPQILGEISSRPYGYEEDQTLYVTSGKASNGAAVSLLYLESKKSDRFEENGLLLDLTVSIYYYHKGEGTFDGSPENVRRLINGHFVNNKQQEEASLESFTSGGKPGWEMVWENEDGTKESSWILIYDAKDSEGNKVPGFIVSVSATKIFKENPLYKKNTSLERD